MINIYTLTLSPSVDLYLDISSLKIGEINRASSYYFYPGGKGINVSLVLKTLGVNSTALGFLGGFTGEYIKGELNEKGIPANFVSINDITRINVKINSSNETAINSPSNKISEEHFQKLLDILKTLKKDDILICSGNVTNSINDKDFEIMLDTLNKLQVKLVIDISGKALKVALNYHPFLIKPNLEEFEELIGQKIQNKDDIITFGKSLIPHFAQNIIISLGKDGAMLLNNKGSLFYEAPKGKVISTVGAGDSLLAGFISEYLKTNDMNKALKKGLIVGSATAFSKGLASKEIIDKIEKEYGGIL